MASVAAMLVSSVAAAQGKLPLIELPEYIISGVEQATKLRGERIPTEVAAKVMPPTPSPEARPDLTSLAVQLKLENPGVQRRAGVSRLSLFAHTGNFQAFGAGLEARRPEQKVDLYLDGAYAHHPRRIQAGREWDWQANGGAAALPLTAVALGARTDFGQGSYEYGSSQRYKILRWSDAGVALTTAPVVTGVGLFSASALWKQTAYSELYELDESEARFKVSYERAQKRWLWSSAINWESGIQDGFGDVHSTAWTAALRVALTDKFSIVAGGIFSAGGAEGRDLVPNLWPVVGGEYYPGFGGRLKLGWEPGVVVVTRRELFVRYPMMVETTGGAFIETPARLKAEFWHWLDRLELLGAVEWSRSRHVSMLADTVEAAGVTLWRLEPRKVNHAEARLKVTYQLDETIQLFAEAGAADARSSGSAPGGNAPDVAPYYGMVGAAYRWRSWTFNGSLDGFAQTPLRPDNSIARPAYADVGLAVQKGIGSNITVGIKGANLLNQRYGRAPFYDEPPAHFSLNIGYQF